MPSGCLKQADYPAAEAALKAFIEQHPKDPMAGNAQYWLGETYYTRSSFMEAASDLCRGLQALSERRQGAGQPVEARHVARRAPTRSRMPASRWPSSTRRFPHAGAARSRSAPPRRESASAAERTVCCHRERSEAMSTEVRTTVEIVRASAPRNERARPLSDAEFAAAWPRSAGSRRAPFLAVAVSGGPDSWRCPARGPLGARTGRRRVRR